MKKVILKTVMGCAVATLAFSQAIWAQESVKPLPTLLIKGEVVSVDSADPAATLLKVKDRYGFETPIYLTDTTKIVKGDQASSVADLTPGVSAEVEYNFDINTAKRHAVNVTLSVPVTEAAVPSEPAPVVNEVPVPSEASVPVVEEQTQDAPVIEETATQDTVVTE